MTVTSPGDSGTGSLRAAITVAQSGDTIVFAPTLFSSTQTTTTTKKGKGKSPPPPPPPPANTILLTSGQVTLTKNLAIQGFGADQLTISGNNAFRVFEVAGGVTATLSGMTITQGYGYFSGGNGGGILNNGTLTVKNGKFSRNNAKYGGGIYNAGGTLAISDSTLGGGSNATAGAGIYNAGGIVAVSSSTLSGNWATNGAGIYNAAGTLMIANSALSSNYAHFDYSVSGGYGGGIYNAGIATISNSILTGNTADGGLGGGGIYNAAGGTLTVRNSSSITGNFGSYEFGDSDITNLGVLQQDGTSTIGVLYGNTPILI